MNTLNLSDKYNLENDSRLTLPDDSILVFNHDMIKGHLEGYRLQGGNFIKISRIPAKTKVYWNSKFDRQSAKLLDESNRGIRILKQNDNKILMTFQNFYIWTEGNLDDVENWSDNQRMLQLEISGVGAEITPLVANPSSDIYVDKVESVGDINHLLNFGKKDSIVEAGQWAKTMQSNATATTQQTLQIAQNTATSNTNEAEIIENLESLNATATSSENELKDINTELDGQSTKLDTANASLDTANASLDTANDTLTAIKTEQEAQGTQLETSNANTQSSATSLLAIKDKQAQDSLTLTNISANIMAVKTNTDDIETALNAFKDANHTDLTAFKDANHTDLTAFKDANHTDITALATKLETGLQLLDSKLALLNLEATQQDIVSKINTINLQLNTMNTILQNGLIVGRGLEIPSDFNLEFFNLFEREIPTALSVNNHYTHYHIRINVNNNTAGFNDPRFTPVQKYLEITSNNNIIEHEITNFAQQAPRKTRGYNSLMNFGSPYSLFFKCNYQFHYELQVVLSYRAIGDDGEFTTFDAQKATELFLQKPLSSSQPKAVIGISQGTDNQFEGQGGINLPAEASFDYSNIHRINISSPHIMKQQSTDNTKYMWNDFYTSMLTPTRPSNATMFKPNEAYLNFYIVEVGKKIT